MAGHETDTIGGFNSMLNKQKKAEGEAFVTTVVFNHQYEILHDRINVKGISPITEADYEVGGTTALLDAIGFSIQKIVNVQKHTSKDERANKVLFVITTDGMENASHEFTANKIKKMIETQKVKHGWDFMFIGANIDAIATTEAWGRTLCFHILNRLRLNFTTKKKQRVRHLCFMTILFYSSEKEEYLYKSRKCIGIRAYFEK